MPAAAMSTATGRLTYGTLRTQVKAPEVGSLGAFGTTKGHVSTMIITPWDPDPQALLRDGDDMAPAEPYTPSRGERIRFWLAVALAFAASIWAGVCAR